MSEQQKEQEQTSTTTLIIIGIIVLIIMFLYFYFIQVPIMRHASKTGSAMAVFLSSLAFPLNFTTYRYPVIV